MPVELWLPEIVYKKRECKTRNVLGDKYGLELYTSTKCWHMLPAQRYNTEATVFNSINLCLYKKYLYNSCLYFYSYIHAHANIHKHAH